MNLKAYYASLKPERTYANVLTTAAGFLFASRWHGHWLLFLYTLLGTTLIVMSACAVNNITDRGIDARMPRTQKRGTVTGNVSAGRLGITAAILAVVGFSILIVHVNWLTAWLGVTGYVDYVVLYAWSKRHTPRSTLIGTISGAVPLMAGYGAVTNQLNSTAILLGLIMVVWQMVHFYAIAIFRMPDYASANIPVWPLRFGVKNTQLWMLGYTLLYLLFLLIFALISTTVRISAGISIVLGLYWLFLGLKGIRGQGAAEPTKWARSMFRFSLVILLVFSVTITLSPLATHLSR